MVAWLFPIYDPDTLEPTIQEMTLNKIDDYHAIGSDGPVNVPLFDESALDWLARLGHDSIDNKLQCPFVVTGKAGRGKSTFAIKFLQKMWIGFNVSHIHFWIEPFMSGLEKFEEADPSIKYYPCQLYDEAITGLFNQEWQDARSNVKTLNIVRKKGITAGYVTPSLGDLNPKVLPNMQFWVFIFKRGVAEIRFPMVNQFNGSVYWKPICAIAYGEMHGDLWSAYETSKDGFIQDFTHGVNQGEIGSKKVITLTDQRNSLIEWVVEEEWATQEEVADRLKVKPNTISMWKSRAKAKAIV